MVKIGFGYKARSGKDTAAEYLLQKHGGKQFKFAAALYELTEVIYDFVGHPWVKNRELLQYIGSDFGRKLDPNLWVKLCVKGIREFAWVDQPQDGRNYFVTDMRFPNEAAALKEEGFVLVLIDRPAKARNISEDVPEHISETALDGYTGWDFVISNNGTLEAFYAKIDQLYFELSASN